jgi:hypothetical protein
VPLGAHPQSKISSKGSELCQLAHDDLKAIRPSEQIESLAKEITKNTKNDGK